ncbi:MAG: zf-HC2 domain-containing protein, partial [Dongiaceae bacterium]
MDCNQAISLIDAYIDGELDLSSMLTLESHFSSCPRCRAQRDAKLLLSARLRAGLDRHVAPADLR